MHVTSGIIAALFLAVAVSAQSLDDIKHESRLKTWKVPAGLKLPPCRTTCPEGQICRKNGFAANIRACGARFDWQYCKGFCVKIGEYADEAEMKP
ncbi:unnamed protein product [Mortierella alpina]